MENGRQIKESFSHINEDVCRPFFTDIVDEDFRWHFNVVRGGINVGASRRPGISSVH
jgi:hypothetical protein